MKCEEYEEQISELLDQELDDGRSRNLFAHLSGCEACRGFFDSVQKLRETLRDSALTSHQGVEEWRAHHHPARTEFPMVGDKLRVTRLFRKRYSISVAATILLLFAAIGGTALVSSSFRPAPRVVERRVQETVYVLQLPQVEIKGYYSGSVKSN